MKNATSSNSLALAVLTAVVGGFIGASASTAYINHDGYRHSVRSEHGSINRASDMELLEQERRTARIRAEQEATFMAAPEMDADMQEDARLHHRAYRWCMFNGYDSPRRITTCVDSYIQNGTFDVLR